MPGDLAVGLRDVLSLGQSGNRIERLHPLSSGLCSCRRCEVGFRVPIQKKPAGGVIGEPSSVLSRAAAVYLLDPR